MKTAISLPDPVYKAAEKLSRRKHMSRSEFYATAIRWYIDKEEKSGITQQLNAVYGQHCDVDPVIENTGIVDLSMNDWS
jgi:metal-responsive CopG/Arc/MetJ family transcriptional regulator